MRHSPAQTLAIRRQRGASVLAIIAVVAVVVVGLVVYKERSRAAARAEQQRIELVQRQEAERVQKEKDAAAQREALQEQAQRAAQEKRDLLAQSLKQFDDVVVRFYDATRVAGSTSRIALAQPVATMQALRREATQLAAPPCLATGRDDLIEAMTAHVDAYIAFMQNRDKLGDILAAAHFEKAEKSTERYRSARAACPAP